MISSSCKLKITNRNRTNGLNGNEEGHIFVGNINEDLKREGEGKTYFKHGGSFHGIWANDRLNGLGILYR